MPTISEIEAERAKILAEIENRAKQSSGNSNASLRDFFNAAKEVVPDAAMNNQNPAANAYQNTQSFSVNTYEDSEFDQDVSTSFSQAMQNSLSPELDSLSSNSTENCSSANRNSSMKNTLKNPQISNGGFSIASMLLQISLFSIFAIILYFGYRNMTQELSAIREETTQEIAALKEAVEKGGLNEQTQKQMAQMDERVAFLESQLSQLQEQMSDLQSQPTKSIDFSQINLLTSEEKSSLQQTLSIQGGITEAVLDEKLRRFNEQLANQLDARLDRKLQPILNKLNLSVQKTPVTIAQPDEESEMIAQPDIPEVAPIEMSTGESKPLAERPLLSMVAPKSAPNKDLDVAQIAPIKPIEKPKVDATKNPVTKPIAKIEGISEQDIKWIQEQPQNAYTLQLASMKTAQDLQRLAQSKGLTNTKILPQVRNGTTNYILLLDSLSDRNAAKKIASDIKRETGISPWIRKFQDVQQKLSE